MEKRFRWHMKVSLLAIFVFRLTVACFMDVTKHCHPIFMLAHIFIYPTFDTCVCAYICLFTFVAATLYFIIFLHVLVVSEVTKYLVIYTKLFPISNLSKLSN